MCLLGFCQVLGSGVSTSGKSLSNALGDLLLKQSFSTWALLTLGLKSSFFLGRDVYVHPSPLTTCPPGMTTNQVLRH